MTEKLQFNDVNKIPSLTWNWLKMNRDSLTLDGTPLVFAPGIAEIPDGFSLVSGGNFDLSQFSAIKAGIGTELSDYLEKNVFKGVDQIIEVNGITEKPLVLSFDYSNTQKNAASSQIIYARKNSESTVIFMFEGESEIQSFVRTKVYAESGAKIHVVKVQLLSKNHNQADDTSALALEDARIHFTQIELGGNHVNAGLSVSLSEHKAKFKSEFAFICKGSQHLDINHEVIHTGSETDTKMLVKGVVDGNALKTYRGTIDFKHGCHGATGDEQEETLLMSRTAVNKSIPVILCDEEDVSGSHGASLGRLGADELFYMQSRGISEDEAKKMMTRAKILSVASEIPSEEVRAKIEAFLG